MPDILTAGCLAVLVFNDMLSTSHMVESKKEVRYGTLLMLIDLCNFLLLATAMIVISPTANLFEVSLTRIAGILKPPSFWFCLAAYWVLLMVWTHNYQKQFKGQMRVVRGWQATVALVLFAEWLLHVVGLTDIADAGSFVTLTYLMLYLTCIRPFIRDTPAPEP